MIFCFAHRDERHARPGKKPKTDEQGEEIPEEEEDLNESNYDEVRGAVGKEMVMGQWGQWVRR